MGIKAGRKGVNMLVRAFPGTIGTSALPAGAAPLPCCCLRVGENPAAVAEHRPAQPGRPHSAAACPPLPDRHRCSPLLQDEKTADPEDPAYQARKTEKRAISKIPYVLANIWKKVFNKKKAPEGGAAGVEGVPPTVPVSA